MSRTIDTIKRYFKNRQWTNTEGNELAIRQSDYTIIDVTLTEELAFKDGWNQAIDKVLEIINKEIDNENH